MANSSRGTRLLWGAGLLALAGRVRRDDLCHTETLQIAYLRREGSNYFQNLCFSVSKEDDEGTVVTTHISV